MGERICIMLSGLFAGVSVFLYGVIFFFSEGITQIFNSEGNAELQAIAVTGLKLYFLAVFFAGTNISMAIYFTSTNRALPAHVISLLRGLLLIVPAAFLLGKASGDLWCVVVVSGNGGPGISAGVDNLLCIQTKECILIETERSTAMQWTEAQAHTIEFQREEHPGFCSGRIG